MDKKQIVVVTGMSGAGKTTVLKFLEDIGFYCADNLPPALIPRFAEVCFDPGLEYDRLALGIDIRGGKLFDDLLPAINAIDAREVRPIIIYLDSDDETLHRRYKESRRDHPLAKSGRLIDGITQERGLTKSVRERADYTIDTSNMLTRELKELINDIFLTGQGFSGIIVNIISFGFKYGLPRDADMVFDVRFLPNPFYVKELRELTGNDPPVSGYVMGFEAATGFLEKAEEMLALLMPSYISEGKTRLVLCIGCTGGRHRSVTLANRIYDYLRGLGYSAYVTHRDIREARG
ncbi:MAG: RNase adapter RapZ [Defluviitaleaceae bacterium]|nr:RNase adapter RapZ [Defluviitaleaceae bacterium]MCL2836779.1 RNase adapter RapZ [Defluviitaleaceae bacterium]